MNDYTFEKSLIFTVVSFGYIKQNKICKGVVEYCGKKTLERVRADIKSRYGSMLIEPKVSYKKKTYIFSLKDGTEKKGK